MSVQNGEKSSEMRSSTYFLFMLNYNIWVIKKKDESQRFVYWKLWAYTINGRSLIHIIQHNFVLD